MEAKSIDEKTVQETETSQNQRSKSVKLDNSMSSQSSFESFDLNLYLNDLYIADDKFDLEKKIKSKNPSSQNQTKIQFDSQNNINFVSVFKENVQTSHNKESKFDSKKQYFIKEKNYEKYKEAKIKTSNQVDKNTVTQTDSNKSFVPNNIKQTPSNSILCLQSNKLNDNFNSLQYNQNYTDFSNQVRKQIPQNNYVSISNTPSSSEIYQSQNNYNYPLPGKNSCHLPKSYDLINSNHNINNNKINNNINFKSYNNINSLNTNNLNTQNPNYYKPVNNTYDNLINNSNKHLTVNKYNYINNSNFNNNNLHINSSTFNDSYSNFLANSNNNNLINQNFVNTQYKNINPNYYINNMNNLAFNKNSQFLETNSNICYNQLPNNYIPNIPFSTRPNNFSSNNYLNTNKLYSPIDVYYQPVLYNNFNVKSNELLHQQNQNIVSSSKFVIENNFNNSPLNLKKKKKEKKKKDSKKSSSENIDSQENSKLQKISNQVNNRTSKTNHKEELEKNLNISIINKILCENTSLAEVNSQNLIEILSNKDLFLKLFSTIQNLKQNEAILVFDIVLDKDIDELIMKKNFDGFILLLSKISLTEQLKFFKKEKKLSQFLSNSNGTLLLLDVISYIKNEPSKFTRRELERSFITIVADEIKLLNDTNKINILECILNSFSYESLVPIINIVLKNFVSIFKNKKDISPEDIDENLEINDLLTCYLKKFKQFEYTASTASASLMRNKAESKLENNLLQSHIEISLGNNKSEIKIDNEDFNKNELENNSDEIKKSLIKLEEMRKDFLKLTCCYLVEVFTSKSTCVLPAKIIKHWGVEYCNVLVNQVEQDFSKLICSEYSCIGLKKVFTLIGEVSSFI
jgi:hypothetical protein